MRKFTLEIWVTTNSLLLLTFIKENMKQILFLLQPSAWYTFPERNCKRNFISSEPPSKDGNAMDSQQYPGNLFLIKYELDIHVYN